MLHQLATKTTGTVLAASWLHTELRGPIPVFMGRGLVCPDSSITTGINDMAQVTQSDLKKIQTSAGGYSKAVIDAGMKLYGKGWVKKLLEDKNGGVKFEVLRIRAENNPSRRDKIAKAKKAKVKANKKKGPINPFPCKSDNWSWKPDKRDIPDKVFRNEPKKGYHKKKRERVTKLDNAQFYESKEWRELRVRVLEKYECKCMMCGRNPKEHGIVIHVDHIKPRSKYPELSLHFDNLQLLCDDCNLGKSNKFDTDYRPDK